MTREDKAREEMAWLKITEDIELERQGVEPLLDSYCVYSTEARKTLQGILLDLRLLFYIRPRVADEAFSFRSEERTRFPNSSRLLSLSLTFLVRN